jgi:hypothetical protein
VLPDLLPGRARELAEIGDEVEDAS